MALDLERLRSRPDPAPSWRWNAFIQSPAIGTLSDLQIEGAQLPFRFTDSEARFSAGAFRFYPKLSNIDPLHITFYEDQSYTVTRTIEKWRKAIVDDNGNYGMPRDYWGTAVINLYNYMQANDPVLSIELIEIWPTRQAALELAYDNSSKMAVSCEFSVNTARFAPVRQGNVAVEQISAITKNGVRILNPAPSPSETPRNSNVIVEPINFK